MSDDGIFVKGVRGKMIKDGRPKNQDWRPKKEIEVIGTKRHRAWSTEKMKRCTGR